MLINEHDTQILRELAAKQAEAAASPEMAKKADLWRRHNDLETNEPVISMDPQLGWCEILDDADLQCEGELARSWEKWIRMNLFWAYELKDDTVIDDLFPVEDVYTSTGWGLDPYRRGQDENRRKAYHIDTMLEDYERDFPKLHFPQIIFDDKKTEERMSEAHRVFDGLLQPFSFNMYWWSLGYPWGITRFFVAIRGLENFLCDFYEEPEWMKKMIDFLTEGTMQLIDSLEENNRLRSNTGNILIGSGGFGFTNQLPTPAYPGAPVKCRDMWGFVESQETSTVSPQMYGEFVFPALLKLASRFGLNAYGCCEPFENKWDWIKQIPNLRRISVSPWANRPLSMEILGNKYLASHKLHPGRLATPVMDEDVVRKDLREALDVSINGCPELIMKDTTTLGGSGANAIRWVQLAREEIAKT